MAREATAAHRVSAIPELLEQILLDLAAQLTTQTPYLNQHDEHKLEPITTLSRCQAVNRTFHATIAGSNKVQRLTQHAEPEGRRPDVSLDIALNWLFEKELGLVLLKIARSTTTTYYEVKASSYSCVIIENTPQLVNFRRRHSSPGATWRQVGVHDRGSTRDAKIAVPSLMTEIDTVGFNCFLESPDRASLEVGPHDTLGMVFDKFCAVLETAA